MVQRDTHTIQDNIIRRMRFACWLDKFINTQSAYNLLIFHVNIKYTTVHGCKYIACIVLRFSLQIVLLIYINH
jgi:hypothetical protein